MFQLLTIAIFIWLLVKATGFALKLTWGVAKVIASILIVLALPILIVCLVFLSGIALLVPVAVVGMAFAILKTCV